MSEAKRYKIQPTMGGGCARALDADGAWVLYADHAAEIAALREELSQLRARDHDQKLKIERQRKELEKLNHSRQGLKGENLNLREDNARLRAAAKKAAACLDRHLGDTDPFIDEDDDEEDWPQDFLACYTLNAALKESRDA